MKTRVSSLQIVLASLIGLAYSAMFSAAYATGGVDFTAVTAAIDVSTVLAAIAALAALKVMPGFTKWAYNKVIAWFK